MKNRRWVVAVIIMTIVAVAFFYNVNNTVKPLEDSKTTSKENIKNDVALTKDYKKQENKKKSVLIELQKKKAEKEKSKKKDIAINEIVESKKKDKIKTNKEVNKITENQKKVKINTNKGKKDKFLTDPTPIGKPKPVEPENVTINSNEKYTCTLSVTCASILNNMSKFNKDKLEVLPKNGMIYKTQTVSFSKGEAVFDVLLREMKKNKIHMEFEMTPIYNSNYIEGINNLYEFDCGELSGWMYKVNGWYPNYGCSRYVLKKGDVIEWVYTCDLGRDIGGDTVFEGEER
ncbi:DUF4430 domain-containing protein [Clostridium tagluense]|uniref:DUF4430 domain-containing protein n=1 Tax=Clostridium tagluense TaxID=360422 RepID=UPI001CF290A8|nr:DUF4430 domain-containing protein [Clostridium tagluense]MCB2310895.1 DUF4430 domain-containing protein [Clostridium tagluense]MCB2315749.1 DUF4430 domain-containing protein [Clostridium tagluense]MCB2320607.1 DUF4430 domain-containing protein [Clostridium tagluense]MCB2325488.1 DUF4430 domain-containing protein [Clostridium tagluense]MCB2330341.1 DUF4430 domain-containing protein [Clostridium tagluense]